MQHCADISSCADDATADDGQQRKRRGRIGNMAAEASAPTKDSQRATALEPAEDLLADGPDGDRGSGEMLMECVVKVGQLSLSVVSCTACCTVSCTMSCTA